MTELLFDFYDELPYTLITGITVESIQELQHKNDHTRRLSILLEPAVVHDLGICGLAVVLDLCHLLATISISLREEDADVEREEEREVKRKVDEGIEHALSIRLALLFLSKRKYFPALFTAAPRDCKIYKHISRIGKAVSPQVLFLATFLR